MKLDRRIKSRSFIFDCFNAGDAEKYVGEECYMTGDIELFKDLNRVQVYRLDKIAGDSFFYNNEEDEYFEFCLPVSLVEHKEIDTEELKTDEELLKDLYDSLGDLIDCCLESKEYIKDMENWEVAHDIEFQLEMASETLRRYLAKLEEIKNVDDE